jgi:hypothetical protein
VAHVVLFSPRAAVAPEQREAFLRAFEQAIAAVPEIQRLRVGRRLAVDRPYEQLGPSYEFIAILEFASADGLRRYLEHPAHDALADAFYLTLDQALAADFALEADVRALGV